LLPRWLAQIADQKSRTPAELQIGICRVAIELQESRNPVGKPFDLVVIDAEPEGPALGGLLTALLGTVSARTPPAFERVEEKQHRGSDPDLSYRLVL
jgi:hypothetical protein